MIMLLRVLSLWASLLVACSATSPTPIVIWHGMGDSCCSPLSMGSITRMVKGLVPGVYVRSLEIGNGIVSDTLNGFFMPIADQITLACDKVKGDPKLANGFHAMGFSQGGQFLRALVQKCEGIQMKNLITFGGQHQGVAGFPNCPVGGPICDSIRDLVNTAAYRPVIQNRLVQAQYWHDAADEDAYKTQNIFLPELNNEVTVNEEYKQRLGSLDNFVMVRFNNDTMVQPLSSEWFGFYEPGQDVIEAPLEETAIYKEDRLGLKVMNEAGKLVFLDTDGEHLQFSNAWFEQHILQYIQ